MSDLEDSVELGPAPGASPSDEEVAKPARKLGRLRKAGQLLRQDGENAAPNAKAAAGDSPAAAGAKEQLGSGNHEQPNSTAQASEEQAEAGDADAGDTVPDAQARQPAAHSDLQRAARQWWLPASFTLPPNCCAAGGRLL